MEHLNTPAVRHRLLSVEDYLALEEASTIRHEYVAGQIFALAGATKRHNRIILNIATRLIAAARGGPCRIYTESVKLRAAEDLFYYPDVIVACGAESADPLIEDVPCLLVEVISSSTEMIDRREKLAAYKRIPSLEAYLVVDHKRRRMERHWRDDEGTWWQADAVGAGEVPVPCPAARLSLDQIYDAVTFGD